MGRGLARAPGVAHARAGLWPPTTRSGVLPCRLIRRARATSGALVAQRMRQCCDPMFQILPGHLLVSKSDCLCDEPFGSYQEIPT